MMKNIFIKISSIITISIILTACGGGNNATTSEPAVTPEIPAINISVMVDGIITENVDHADHTTWNLDNFEVVDDIDGNFEAETAMNAMVDVLVAAEEAKP